MKPIQCLFDTCGCVIKFETNDEKGKTVATLVTKCPDHAELSDEQAVHHAWEQNKRKNRVLAELCDILGYPEEGTHEYVDTWYEGKGAERVLHVKPKKSKVKKTQKQKIRKKLKDKKGIIFVN